MAALGRAGEYAPEMRRGSDGDVRDGAGVKAAAQWGLEQLCGWFGRHLQRDLVAWIALVVD